MLMGSQCRPVELEDLNLAKAVNFVQYPLPLGSHADDSEPVTLNSGKFGLHAQAGNLTSPVPKLTIRFADGSVAAS